MSNKSVFDLDERIAAVLCYALGFLSGACIYVMERENKFVRFHALQSMVWFLVILAASIVLSMLSRLFLIGILASFLYGLVGFIGVLSWIGLMYMAFKGAKFKIPVLGDAVENYLNK